MMASLMTRICVQCGSQFVRPAWREKQRAVKFCSLACLGLFRRDRHERRCEQCSRVFWVRQSRVKPREDRFCSRSCYGRYKEKLPMTRRVAARDGDHRQAVRRVREMVGRGFLPRAKAVPCVDCGHKWTPGGPRHEYDHYLGYADAEQHETVEVVCSRCHRRRTNIRPLQSAFVAGWLLGLQGELVLADKWLEWVNK